VRVVLKLETDILQKVEEISGQNTFSCYQCGMCSAGCPMSEEMDLLPNQVIRLMQMGAFDELSSSSTIWLCASCYTCRARCPRGVALSRLMEAVRLIILRKTKDDYISPEKMVKEELPQIALISALRKFTR
jgi:heterodisulfide reductase subunit C